MLLARILLFFFAAVVAAKEGALRTKESHNLSQNLQKRLEATRDHLLQNVNTDGKGKTKKEQTSWVTMGWYWDGNCKGPFYPMMGIQADRCFPSAITDAPYSKITYERFESTRPGTDLKSITTMSSYNDWTCKDKFMLDSEVLDKGDMCNGVSTQNMKSVPDMTWDWYMNSMVYIKAALYPDSSSCLSKDMESVQEFAYIPLDTCTTFGTNDVKFSACNAGVSAVGNIYSSKDGSCTGLLQADMAFPFSSACATNTMYISGYTKGFRSAECVSNGP